VSGVLTWARLSFRQQRWELLFVAVGAIGLGAVMLWFASHLADLRATMDPACLNAQTFIPVCQVSNDELARAQDLASTLLSLAWVAPFGMGLLLGAPLVAREIDHGTTQLAWTLSRSRVRWLLGRVAFVLLVTLALLAILAVTSEILARAIRPDLQFDRDFTWTGRRGWLLMARGGTALLLAVLVGTVVGRVLPALLAAIFVVALTFTGISVAQDGVLRQEANVVRANFTNPSAQDDDPGALQVDGGIQLTDGTVYTYREMPAHGINATYTDETGRTFASEEDIRAGNVLGYEVSLEIPGARYPEVAAREGAATGGIGLLALALAAFVVRQRRPA
jgi:hypothetical protein